MIPRLFFIIVLLFSTAFKIESAIASQPHIPNYQTEIVSTQPDSEGRVYGFHHPTFGPFEDKFFDHIEMLDKEKESLVIEFGAGYARVSHKILSKTKNPKLHIIVNDLVSENLGAIQTVKRKLEETKTERSKERAERLHIVPGDCLLVCKDPTFNTLLSKLTFHGKINSAFAANLIHFQEPPHIVEFLAYFSENLAKDGKLHLIAQTSYILLDQDFEKNARIFSQDLADSMTDEAYDELFTRHPKFSYMSDTMSRRMAINFCRDQGIKYLMIGKKIIPGVSLTVEEFSVLIDPPLLQEIAQAVNLEVESLEGFNYMGRLGGTELQLEPARINEATFVGYVLKKSKNTPKDFKSSQVYQRVHHEASQARASIDALFRKNGKLYRQLKPLKYFPFLTVEEL